jgi:short-subunit dehydrogenase
LSSVYSASKFAMEGWTDSLRREVRGFNISVSIVQPAYVKTQIFDKTVQMNEAIMLDDAVKEEITSLYPGLYSEKARVKRANGVAGADSPSVTSEAIYHAIHSKRPSTRYAVANFNGIPAKIIVHLLRIFPDYVIDAVFNQV